MKDVDDVVLELKLLYLDRDRLWVKFQQLSQKIKDLEDSVPEGILRRL